MQHLVVDREEDGKAAIQLPQAPGRRPELPSCP
ncbi:MAG: hypothetical protein ACLRWQ_09375 [Flavonifractor plautii]